MANLEVNKGDDVTITVTFKTSAGVVINITGYTVYFYIKTSLTDKNSDALLAKTVTSHTNPTQGVTTIILSHAETTTLPRGTYPYNLQLVSAGGSVQSTDNGYVDINQMVKNP